MKRCSQRQKLPALLALVVAITILALGMVSEFAVAGAGSSGGGDVLRDDFNPWFIQNTKVVRYCVEVDAAHFHQDLATLHKLVEDGIQYWKAEFKQAYLPPINGSYLPDMVSFEPVRVATQTFQIIDCDSSEDIRFQFGILRKNQKIFIDDPHKVIAAAVREQYDPQSLRGRGFIYISPDSGPLQFQGDDLQTDFPWSLGGSGALFRVIVHELGHVFGLQHRGDAGQVMAAGYPEFVLNKLRATTLAKTMSLPGYFAFNGELSDQICQTKGFNSKFAEFFGIAEDTKCFGISLAKDQVTVTIGSGPSVMEVGKITLKPMPNYKTETVVTLYLPEDQRIFKVVSTYARILPGPARKTALIKGVFKPRNSRSERNLLLVMPPDNVRSDKIIESAINPISSWPSIGGVLDGEMILDLMEGF